MRKGDLTPVNGNVIVQRIDEDTKKKSRKEEAAHFLFDNDNEPEYHVGEVIESSVDSYRRGEKVVYKHFRNVFYAKVYEIIKAEDIICIDKGYERKTKSNNKGRKATTGDRSSSTSKKR